MKDRKGLMLAVRSSFLARLGPSISAYCPPRRSKQQSQEGALTTPGKYAHAHADRVNLCRPVSTARPVPPPLAACGGRGTELPAQVLHERAGLIAEQVADHRRERRDVSVPTHPAAPASCQAHLDGRTSVPDLSAANSEQIQFRAELGALRLIPRQMANPSGLQLCK
jgi:hypothetical protein